MEVPPALNVSSASLRQLVVPVNRGKQVAENGADVSEAIDPVAEAGFVGA